MRFGAQVSVAGGARKIVERAQQRGCECVQLFSSNPREWALTSADDASLQVALRAADIHPVILHTPYLVNIAARDPVVYARSVAALVHAALRAARLDAMVVVHAGRDQAGPRHESISRAAAALLTARKLVPRAPVLVEPTAGGRGSVASTLTELQELLEAAPDSGIGVCLDTCHAHAAGHNLSSRRFLTELETRIGMQRVLAIHANDSRDPRGSARDRHWHVGQGKIGEPGFRRVLSDRRLAHAAVIVETPGTVADDLQNLARAREYALDRARRRP